MTLVATGSSLILWIGVLCSAISAFSSTRQNQPADFPSQLTSPKSNFLLDRSSGKYYNFGTKGPCGTNMIFYRDPQNSKYGFCDCDQGVKSNFPCSDHAIRRLIYEPKSQSCFFVFSQGPCRKGHWVNIGKDSEPICEPNPCLRKYSQGRDEVYDDDSFHQFWYFDPKRKSCFRTLSRGYCPVGLSLEVVHHDHIPKCRRSKPCFSKITNFRSSLTCKAGSRYSFLFRGCTIKPSYLKYNFPVIG